MPAACRSNRPQELRDAKSSAGCVPKSSLLLASSPSISTASTRIEAVLPPIHIIHHLNTRFPSTLPFPFMSPCPSMTDKYCCCLLSTFRYELGSHGSRYDAWSGDMSKKAPLRHLVHMRAEIRVVTVLQIATFYLVYIDMPLLVLIMESNTNKNHLPIIKHRPRAVRCVMTCRIYFRSREPSLSAISTSDHLGQEPSTQPRHHNTPARRVLKSPRTT
jgi:hypothetical protein